jgi:uncharacterized protein (DUF1800 family)
MNGSRASLAHLYRRAGFGRRPDEIDAAVVAGYGASVEHLLDRSRPDPAAAALTPPQLTTTFTPPSKDPTTAMAEARSLAQEGRSLALWWLQRMAAASSPLPEKLALLWHGHFATSLQKVRYPKLMYDQNQLFRALGAGSFASLTHAVAKDPAMLVWLDASTDKKSHPNENFSRELMELFTLGIGNYSEDDVREAARCFTGWVFDRQTGSFALQARQHDNDVKTVLGHTGNLTGEDVIDLVTHSPVGARYVVAKLWSHLSYPVKPSDSVVSDLVPGYAADLDLTGLLRGIFMHPQFTSDTALKGLVKQPIEYVAGSLRALRLPVDQLVFLAVLEELGQVPFAPPSVGGWPQNAYWLSTAAATARLRFANFVAARADLSAIADESPAQRADAAAHLLSVDSWSPTTSGALARVAGDPRALTSLALVSPEYVSN